MNRYRQRAGLLLSLMLVAAPALAVDGPSASPAMDSRITSLLTQLGNVHDIDAVALSPNGQRLAWVVDRDGKPMIELAHVDGSMAHPLDASIKPGSCSQEDITWSPDSTHLAYLSDCADPKHETKHLMLASVGGSAKPASLATLTGYAHALSFAPDGKAIGFLYVAGATRRTGATAAAKAQTGVISGGDTNLQRVATVAIGGGTPQPISPDDRYVYEFSFSPTSDRIATVAAPPPGDNNWWVAQLYVQSANAGAAARSVVDPNTIKGSLHGLQIALPRWSPDGQRLAFIGGLMSDQGATGGDIYGVPAKGGEVTHLTPGIRVTPAWLTWTGNQQLLVTQIRNGQAQLAEYAVNAAKATQTRVLFTVPAALGDGSAAGALSLSADHRHVAYAQSSFAQAPEVHAGPLGSAPPPAVTRINTALKPAWGKAVSQEWDNDGKHVQGWLLYPANYDPAKRYPMIVYVHGGPSSAVLPRWPGAGYGPVPLSALGYFVLMPNPRGSFGQGEAYVQSNRKDFGYGDLRDILAGVDHVEKTLPVDDQRLGLTGWSYGGFMSMFAPTQTQRFKAVVAGAGLSNWQSYYGQNLIDQWMIPFFGASVYDDPDIYAKSSAINFVTKVRAPTLIVVGENDAETPAPQSFEWWHALRAQGVPTELVVYPGEGHGFRKPEHRRDVLQRALGWFQKYLPASK